MRTILVAKVIDRAGPLSMYSATMVCRTDQNKVAEGLLLGGIAQPMRLMGLMRRPEDLIVNCVLARGPGENYHLPPSSIYR